MAIKINKLDSIYKCLGSHPFICSFLICLLLTPLTFGAEGNISVQSVFIFSILVNIFVLFIVYNMYVNKKLNKAIAILVAAVLTITNMFATKMFAQEPAKGLFVFIAGMVLILLFEFFVSVDKKYEQSFKCLFIMSLSFMIKLFYILITSIYTRQNDVGSFDGTEGHAGYIEFLLTNKGLPDFDVTTRAQYYHPPLHHSICALWLEFVENWCGVSRDLARESLQMLTLFYSMACLIIVYKILRHFKFNGKALFIPLVIFAFHPAYILISGAINNDLLSIVFILATILNTIKWYDNQTIPNIIKIALTVGLGMMSKLSAGLVAPSVALVFLIALIKNKDKFKKYVGQFSVFALLCVPMGLWWSIRNLIKDNVSMAYVPLISYDDVQYIGNIPFLKRLTDLSLEQFKNPFEQWAGRGSYNEYNPTIAIFKNSMFGEDIDKTFFPETLLFIPTLLFWVGIVLAVSSFVFMVIYTFKKNTGLKWEHRAFISTIYLTIMGNFYIFCYNYPHTCTQNFRYITPVVAVGVFYSSMFIKDNQQKTDSRFSSIAVKTFTIISFAFAVLSFMSYYLICTTIEYN